MKTEIKEFLLFKPPIRYMPDSSKTKPTKKSFKDSLMKVHRFYGVEVLFLEPKVNKLQYVLECDYLGYEGSAYKYRMSRQKIFVNDKELTNTMDVLAEKCMNIVYPLILNVGFAGKVIGVANLEEIQERWKNLRQSLAIEYSGKIASDYLKKISVALSSEVVFIEKMEKDVIFKILIPRLHIWGSDGFEKDGVLISIPHPDNSGFVSFKGKQELSPYPDENGCLSLTFNGQYISSDSMESDYETKGTLFLQHFLDDKNSSLIRMFGRCNISNGKESKVEYKIIRLKEHELIKI